jgi:IS5 family transposase
MDEIIPWEEWVDLIKPHYFIGKRGRPPKGIEKMLRMYLLQCWFNLSDEGVEDAIYDSYAFRKFMGINFLEEQVPDATTLLHFRRMMEESKIGEQLFRAINYVIEHSGYLMRGGTIVDATIINAPNSTKNAERSLGGVTMAKARKIRNDIQVGNLEKKLDVAPGTFRNTDGRDTRSDKLLKTLQKEAEKANKSSYRFTDSSYTRVCWNW